MHKYIYYSGVFLQHYMSFADRSGHGPAGSSCAATHTGPEMPHAGCKAVTQWKLMLLGPVCLKCATVLML